MATLTSGAYPTLSEVVNRQNEDGGISTIVEMLNQTNELLDVIPWIECNDGMGHMTSVRTGLPQATWRMLNYGVQPSKSTTMQIRDSVGMLEAYAEVDKKLADMNGNSAEWRLSEDRAFLESMNQAMTETVIYGSNANPERFVGLAPRFNDRTAQSGDNIILGDPSASGSDQTSIYLVVWGPNTVHGLYPKGSVGGFYKEDKGQVTIENVDGNGGRMEAYRTHYKWECGLTVRDWRYVVRIANIDTSALTKNASAGADLIDLMTQALELIPDLNMGRPSFIVNRKVRSFLRRQIVNKVAASTLSMDTVAGRKVVTFSDVPVYRCDSLLNTEAVVA